MSHVRFCVCSALAAFAVSTAAAQGPGGYHVAKKIPIGGEGGWDYVMVDAAAHRLYVSHATKAVVVDLDKDTVVGEIPNTNGIHGIAVAPALHRGFTSNGRDTTVTIFDLKTLATIGTVKVTGAGPDAIIYDDASKLVFTFNGRGRNATVIDAATGKTVGTIPLGGKPEFAQADGARTLFVNIEDTHEVAVIDTRTLTVTRRWTLAGCEEPSGLALDLKGNRLFSACGNKVMVVSDTKTGKLIATVPTGPGTDAAGYDPATHLAFASNGGDGTLTVIKQDNADHYSVLGSATTQRGARTMALDTHTHRIYLADADYEPAPAGAAPQPGSRPRTVPGSFMVLVLDNK